MKYKEKTLSKILPFLKKAINILAPIVFFHFLALQFLFLHWSFNNEFVFNIEFV